MALNSLFVPLRNSLTHPFEFERVIQNHLRLNCVCVCRADVSRKHLLEDSEHRHNNKSNAMETKCLFILVAFLVLNSGCTTCMSAMLEPRDDMQTQVCFVDF